MRRELISIDPASPARLTVRNVEKPKPGHGKVLVRVEATSVNPIDVKRAAGYGQRLLRLKGAAHYPLVLGNDLAGVVETLGPGVEGFVPGQRVYGLVGTGREGGAHASHVVVPQTGLLVAPDDVAPSALSVLPYSFTTAWLALHSTGICAHNARLARVLIHGANGGLGRLALQVLHSWGSRVTAICATGQRQTCLDLGAEVAVEYGSNCIPSLPPDFDVVLNFANWDDETVLASRLGVNALGQATTVHPLLNNFDRLGWLGGAWASQRDKHRVSSFVLSRAPRARYGWTIFKPYREALEALSERVRGGTIALPVGIVKPLSLAPEAFDHVSVGLHGRAVLLP